MSGDFPPLVEVPAAERRSLAAATEWLAGVALPDSQGAVLVRGAPIRSPEEVARARDVLIGKPSLPGESFGSREHLGEGIYSATRWPAERMMCPQHEESYSVTVPRLVLLACLEPATTGGETLLSDSRQLLAELPAELVDRCRTHGWRMTRTFRDRLGVSWRDAFGVADRESLEERCSRDGIEFEWRNGGTELRTTRRRPAVVRHPITGEECWFNHAGFFNEWALFPEEREILVATFGPDGLPLNTFAGDGSPLSQSEVLQIEKAYEAISRPVHWQAGDLLLLDNILMAHGRRAYTGNRRMAKGMGDPVTLN